jgi:hypothetical protein
MVYSVAVLVISPGLNINCPQVIGNREEKTLAKMRALGEKMIIYDMVRCQ